MPEHTIGTREEWQVARDELAKLEAEQAERNEELKSKRLDLPWVPLEKQYEFDTEDGKKTLAELFDGRSQLLAYNIMFGPDYTLGACPGCTNLVARDDGVGRPANADRWRRSARPSSDVDNGRDSARIECQLRGMEVCCQCVSGARVAWSPVVLDGRGGPSRARDAAAAPALSAASEQAATRRQRGGGADPAAARPAC
jgi:hypothetical protein